MKLLFSASVFARELLPYSVLQGLTWGMLWIEVAAAILILIRIFSRRMRMFSPEPSRDVVAIGVDAQTQDGRRVDPYNEVASRYASLSEKGKMTRHVLRSKR